MTAPIDSSMYYNMIDSIGTFPTSASLYHTVEAAYSDAGGEEESVDLSDYYSDPERSDLFNDVAEMVKQSAEAVDNAMMAALENGMGVQDVVNMKLAMTAYKAMSQVAKSTFQLKV